MAYFGRSSERRFTLTPAATHNTPGPGAYERDIINNTRTVTRHRRHSTPAVVEGVAAALLTSPSSTSPSKAQQASAEEETLDANTSLNNISSRCNESFTTPPSRRRLLLLSPSNQALLDCMKPSPKTSPQQRRMKRKLMEGQPIQNTHIITTPDVVRDKAVLLTQEDNNTSLILCETDHAFTTPLAAAAIVETAPLSSASASPLVLSLPSSCRRFKFTDTQTDSTNTPQKKPSSTQQMSASCSTVLLQATTTQSTDASLQSRLHWLESHLKQVETQRLTASNQYKAQLSMTHSLQTQLSSQEQQVAHVTQQYNTLKQEHTQVLQRLQQTQQRLLITQQQGQKTVAESVFLDALSAQQANELTQTKQSLKHIEEENIVLEKQLCAMSSSLSAEQMRYEELKQQVAELMKSSVMLSQKCVEKTEECDRLKEEKEKLMQQVEAMNKEIQEIKASSTSTSSSSIVLQHEAEAELEELRSKQSASEEEREKLQKEIQSLQQALANMADAYTNQCEQNKILSIQFDKQCLLTATPSTSLSAPPVLDADDQQKIQRLSVVKLDLTAMQRSISVKLDLLHKMKHKSTNLQTIQQELENNAKEIAALIQENEQTLYALQQDPTTSTSGLQCISCGGSHGGDSGSDNTTSAHHHPDNVMEDIRVNKSLLLVETVNATNAELSAKNVGLRSEVQQLKAAQQHWMIQKATMIQQQQLLQTQLTVAQEHIKTLEKRRQTPEEEEARQAEEPSNKKKQKKRHDNNHHQRTQSLMIEEELVQKANKKNTSLSQSFSVSPSNQENVPIWNSYASSSSSMFPSSSMQKDVAKLLVKVTPGKPVLSEIRRNSRGIVQY